ncbi:hypothetical protein GW17_00057268, partial [Ensete ventricosum]
MLILILGQKQRIYWVMIGYKDTVGLYNKMRTSIEGLVGQRFVSINWSILADSIGSILQTLSAQGLTSSGGGSIPGSDGGSSGLVPKPILKDRFKSFNMQFEELCLRQCEWTVPDQELRESLRLAVAEVLLPAPMLENNKNPSKYIKYYPENLETKLGELFEGNRQQRGPLSQGD